MKTEKNIIKFNKRIIIVVLLLFITIISGTYAWFNYRSRQSALVLTIGDINDTQIVLNPYQINDTMTPISTYTSGTYSEVTVGNQGNRATSVVFFYKINQLDEVLINNGLKYTITSSSTKDGTYSLVKTGDFKSYDETTGEMLILDINTQKGATVYYRVYLWVDSSIGNQTTIQNSVLDVELNASIGSVSIEGNVSVGETLVANVTDYTQSATYTYQWFSNTTASTTDGTALTEVTSSNQYTITENERGKYIYVVVNVIEDYYEDRIYTDITDSRLKSVPTLTLSPSTQAISITSSGTGTYTYTYDGDGELSCSVSGGSCTISGSNVQYTVSSTGTHTVNLSASEGTDYVAASTNATLTASLATYAVTLISTCPTTSAVQTLNYTKTYGIDLALPASVNACTGYTFNGWGSYGYTYTSNAAVTLNAVWTPNTYTITYNVNASDGILGPTYYEFGEHTFTVPVTGSYKLEVWGAQGGHADYYRISNTSVASGGFGGYSTGTISLTEGTNLYVNVGGMGMSAVGSFSDYNSDLGAGGYNGGGDGNPGNSSITNRYLAGGGGATHIATVSGTLSSLSSNKDKILIVAGGGGGAYAHTTTGYSNAGGHGGGNVGLNGSGAANYGTGGSQTAAGFANGMSTTGVGGFGFGGDTGSGLHGSAGGGGYYGGGGSGGVAAQSNSSGGGGSGYVGNSLLTNKSMYCYNCSASIAGFTATTTDVNGIPTSNYAKKDHGAARLISLSSTESVTYNSSYGELITPSRYGYKFVGWNTAADGTGTYITNTSTVSTASAHTLYAIWEKKCVYVIWSWESQSFNGKFCYGDGTTGNFSPVLSGYTLAGWVFQIWGKNDVCPGSTTGCNYLKYEGALSMSDFWINLYAEFGNGFYDVMPLWKANS